MSLMDLGISSPSRSCSDGWMNGSFCGVAVISAIYAAKNIQAAAADLKSATSEMLKG